ncbi:amidohydrolase family protein [Paraburkholderia rhizosphaerae]|uniref:Putative TIM-barrel fold metal-dependent hydrolase n=1 Tax=Paraburkholderia rhizosphaerae TaxID=480658 RepID=A0A4R8LY27_9BURK|nr:amidohydrolase family protein [Paraburkholderia rhizosphaerae]TDY53244.1 putative TIM-barrel fold metal-dependent hydrolase [Paraburkholderia rhizosphaerae]
MTIPRRIIDSHVHFVDRTENQYPFFERHDEGFEAFVGNYDALPRRYLPADYLADATGYPVEGVVWHEFLSTDAYQEAAWAQRLANESRPRNGNPHAGNLRIALCAVVEFLDPALEQKLDLYAGLPDLTAIREHVVWDDANPRKRFAKRGDLMRDPEWNRRLAILKRYDLKCGLYAFASQLPDLIEVVRSHPDIGFTAALMGWPLDLSDEGFARWKRDLHELAGCDNIRMDISALECLFGMKWSIQDAARWVSTTIETMGVSRCMFGSHMPIAGLSVGFAEVYRRYTDMLHDYSASEADEMFYGVANRWFMPANG